jgi:predicted amidohydrolase YtcJ
MLLRNARVGDDLVDVALDDGHITDVAPTTRIAEARTAHGEQVDLEGRWLVPGLWDNHVHFTQWTLGSRRLDISAAGSARDVACLIGRTLSTAPHPEGSGPLIAVGFRDALWQDAPNLDDLDGATGSTPVVVVSADLHAVWLNSAALALYGLVGHPTGLLREDAAFDITRRIDEVPFPLVDGWAKQAAEAAARRGVVGIVDYEMDWNLDTWQRRMAMGVTSLRVDFGIYTQHLERAVELGLRTGDRINDLLTVGGYKVLTDGSLNTRTAFCYDEYPGLEGAAHSHGMLTVTPDELIPLMRKASDAGITPTVHAIGDRANTFALDAFETLGIPGRIEHAQLLSARDVERFAHLGVVASVQPEHALDDRDVADRLWVGRTARAFVLKSLLRAGAELALGSDAPVAPLDPWVTISAAVGRTRGEREPWHPEQSISVGDAVHASSRSTIARGERADLAVAELDPFTATTAQLRTMPIAATLLGGIWTHNTLA